MSCVCMAGAAHHLDLRAPNAADPPDVLAARAAQARMVAKWVAEDAARRRA